MMVTAGRWGFVFVSLALLFALLLAPAVTPATEEFSRITGKECGYCHLDKSGGGELTEKGKFFREYFLVQGEKGREKRTPSLFRLLVGYLHLLVGILWFGTILYVHLLLKPEYAAHGLPRGELLVGWGSIIIMGVTGVLLTSWRVSSWESLLTTRFGRLLLVKIALYLLMVATALFVTFVLGPRMRESRRKSAPKEEKRGEFTPEELEFYDGKEGRSAFVAFRGSVYDVTGSRLWKGGVHAGKHRAGMDLTEYLAQAPHGEEVMEKVPRVGTFVSGVEEKKPWFIRVFYILAYSNLIIVLAVILIVALWKWG